LTEPGAAAAPLAPGRERALLALVWLLVTVVCALGAPAPAAYLERVTADEPQYLLSAISLAEDRDLNLADELAQGRWRAFSAVQPPEQTRLLPNGERLSPHNPLLPFLLAVPVALGGWLGAKLFLAALAGALAALLVWIALRRFGVAPFAATAVTVVCCCSPPLAIYGTQVYPELPAALATAAALAALTGRLRGRGCALLGAAVVVLPWLGTKYAPVAAVLAALGCLRLARDRNWRPLGWLVAGLGLAGVVYALVHLRVYGGLTPYAVGDHFVGGEFSVVGTEPDYAGRSTRLLGLLTDRGFGLAAWQPLWILAVPALAVLLRRRPNGWDALAAPLAAGWLTATFVALTMHGWWWPGRQVVVVLPAAVLALAWWSGGARRRLALVLGVGALGVVAYAWLLAEALLGYRTLIFDFWETGNPIYRAWSHALPDYRALGRSTWLLHAAWLAATGLLALLAWRRASSHAGTAGGEGAWPPSGSAAGSAAGGALVRGGARVGLGGGRRLPG
jgi:hypothetical protein